VPTLKEIRDKIERFGDLYELVESMRSLAAVALQRSEAAIRSNREHCRIVTEAIGRTLELFSYKGGGGDRGAVAFLVFSSDQGLCGRYNEKITEFALELADREFGGRREVGFLALGKRGAQVLENQGAKLLYVADFPSSIEGIESTIRNLAPEIYERYVGRGFERLFILYNRYRGVGSFEPIHSKILPPDVEALKARDGAAGPGVLTNLPPSGLLADLLREHFFIELHHAMLEAMTSESGSRLRAMDQALHTIERRLDDLGQTYRMLRQEEITNEILDVLGGVRALEGA
jgi:F-type H+-transporting ATPase subunit gamma